MFPRCQGGPKTASGRHGALPRPHPRSQTHWNMFDCLQWCLLVHKHLIPRWQCLLDCVEMFIVLVVRWQLGSHLKHKQSGRDSNRRGGRSTKTWKHERICERLCNKLCMHGSMLLHTPKQLSVHCLLCNGTRSKPCSSREFWGVPTIPTIFLVLICLNTSECLNVTP